ncbi:efflux transporter, RND family, MFP subunit [Pseudopedobacter saltans DSM 12145]|uniref:Efflux transporter, RND family, MFP subunit n=1 Tax=Pseudopedobacter saltans (strain ATCC 51119 / DSM 12145 / JCM 21818 / CCUG 39354 / LMG 10337 / NBRC 100064 / NCIMB 13643) TaxID=762903 RepID=F0S4J9_PSESL|nr:efflux RND transporter periplasmic adaptor subunit [Pseudopedobacter saltans]ADY51990.1 efflux transporter, RND family, MFP subunit [Pseudopedobacter saltans DSM 12145]
MKANTISQLLIASFGIFSISSCTVNSTEKNPEQETKLVPVTSIISLDTIIYNDYIADIQAVKNVELRSRLTGFLEKIYVDEGASVRKGQILFKINDAEYSADLARAEAALNNAIADAKTVELEKQRTELLVNKKIVSKTELELANARFKAAQSKIEEAKSLQQLARTRLSQTLIRAPFDGTIDRIPLKEGSLLEEGALLTSVSDLSLVNVYFDISEKEYLNIATDSLFDKNTFKKKVTLTLANGDVYPFEGMAEFAESEFATNTGSISLRARFKNPQGLLKHGSSGKINVPVETGETLAVHQKSVFEIQDRTYVYKLDKHNKIKMTPFKAGQRIGHFYLIDEGLNSQDQVVFEGVQGLKDGMNIQPNHLKPTEVLAKSKI